MAQNRKYFMLEQDGSNVDIEIYGDITSWPWIESDVSSYNLAQQIKGLTGVDTINVGINSYGGEVSEGLAIYNALKNSPAKVVTRCDGFACSAASVVFAAGDERLMNEASMLMIHNAWTYASGDANALRKQADDLDKITSASVKAYMRVVSVEEDELKQLMDSESWIDPEQAVEIGLATGVYSTESDEVSQSARMKVFQAIRKPLQADDEEDPDDEQDTGDNGGNSGENDPNSGQNDPETGQNDGNSGENDPDSSENDPDSGDNGGDSTGDGDDTDDNDEEKDAQQNLAQFFAAIFK